MTNLSQAFVTLKVIIESMNLSDALTIMDRKCDVIRIIKLYDDQVIEHPKGTFTLTRRVLVEATTNES